MTYAEAFAKLSPEHKRHVIARERREKQTPFYFESRNCVDRQRCQGCPKFKAFYGCTEDITQIENCPILYRLPEEKHPQQPLTFADSQEVRATLNMLEDRVNNHSHSKKSNKYNRYSVD